MRRYLCRQSEKLARRLHVLDAMYHELGGGLPAPHGSEPGLRRPYLIVQNNITNRSRISTVVVCSLTSNLGRAASPGNVLLRAGEASLPRRSPVNVSQLFQGEA
jgi:hypothetical protein